MPDNWWKRANFHNLADDPFSDISDRLFWTVRKGPPAIEERRAALMAVASDITRQCMAAQEILAGAIGNERWKEREAISSALSDASSLALVLTDLFSEYSAEEVKLTLDKRGSGRPVDWPSRVEKLRTDNQAARIVERLVSSGRQKTWAVLYVSEKRNVSRKHIYEALARREYARSIIPDADESFIVSQLFLSI